MVQFSHPSITTGKAIALTGQTFVCRLMSLLFNMLSRFVIAFLPRSKSFWIPWLHSASGVILELRKVKSVSVSTLCLSFIMKWWDRMPWPSFFECWVLSQLSHCPLWLSSVQTLHFLLTFSQMTMSSSCLRLSYAHLSYAYLHIWGWSFSPLSWFQVVLRWVCPFVWCTLHIS